MIDRYRTLASPAQARWTQSRSRFTCHMEPVDDEAAAVGRLVAMKREHRDASHICFAYRVFSPPEHIARSDDAGEPSGSAGVPILRVLEGAGLFNVLAIVVRVFGGVKLGVGGLARAYAAVVTEALSAASIVERRIEVRLSLRFPPDVRAPMLRLIHHYGARILDIRYDESASVSVALSPAVVDRFCADVRDETGARVLIEVNA